MIVRLLTRAISWLVRLVAAVIFAVAIFVLCDALASTTKILRRSANDRLGDFGRRAARFRTARGYLGRRCSRIARVVRGYARAITSGANLDRGRDRGCDQQQPPAHQHAPSPCFNDTRKWYYDNGICEIDTCENKKKRKK